MQGPTAAAIGNAVFNALGARVRDLPLTRERILAAIAA
jgi:CO/xanthine dehydrogenase Mo-binding subunit